MADASIKAAVNTDIKEKVNTKFQRKRKILFMDYCLHHQCY